MMDDKILEHVISVIKDLKEEGAIANAVGTGEKVSLPPAIEPPGRPKNRFIFQRNTRRNWKK
jgi:hypothetical protein